MSGITRRRFLHNVAAGATVLGAGGLEKVIHAQPVLPDPAASGIEHIVLVMMENRSFDHYLGCWCRRPAGRFELYRSDRSCTVDVSAGA